MSTIVECTYVCLCLYRHLCVCVSLCVHESERIALVRLSSSVYSIILIGFIRGLKSNTTSVCCLRLCICVCMHVCVCVYVCMCVACLMFSAYQVSHKMLST